MTDVIIYEQPLMNEIVRTCLRLEQVFGTIEHFLEQCSIWDYRAGMWALTDAMSILDRPDFKGKITQELLRYKTSLQQLQNHKDVDNEKLQPFITQIEENIDFLDSHHGKLGDSLRDNVFLTTIRHNLQKAGGACDFETPNYHYWLYQTKLDQHGDLEKWYGELAPVKKLISLMLQLIRDSTEFTTTNAASGSYQQILDPNLPYQLLRIAIPKSSNVFPEVSVGRHRFSICFRKPSTTEHTVQIKDDLKFQIACCKL